MLLIFLGGPTGPIHPVWALAAIHPRWGNSFFCLLHRQIYENHANLFEMGPYGSIWLDTAAKMIVRTLRIFFVFKKSLKNA